MTNSSQTFVARELLFSFQRANRCLPRTARRLYFEEQGRSRTQSRNAVFARVAFLSFGSLVRKTACSFLQVWPTFPSYFTAHRHPLPVRVWWLTHLLRLDKRWTYRRGLLNPSCAVNLTATDCPAALTERPKRLRSVDQRCVVIYEKTRVG
jgi:hypothetical protein